MRLPVKVFYSLAGAYCLLVAALGIGLDRYDLQLVQTFDKVAGDWRVALGSPTAPDQRTDVAVVLVTEDTLLDYEFRSPVDRLLISHLMRFIDQTGPRAIVLDFIFDRRTRSDAELIKAITDAKAPVVLGGIDERVRDVDGTPPCESLERQQAWLKAAGRPSGHTMFERKSGRLPGSSDNTVRLLAEPLSPASETLLCKAVTPPAEALADVVGRAVGARVTGQQRRIAWLRQPRNGADLFETLAVPGHDPAAAAALTAKLEAAGWRDRLKNRVVLIGAQMIDRDFHETPLSVVEGPVPGVMIHAQAIAQRLDGNRDISVLPWWGSLLVVTMLACLTFKLARTASLNPYGIGWGLGGLLSIGLTGLLALKLLSVELPSIALATVWVLGGWGGYLSRTMSVR